MKLINYISIALVAMATLNSCKEDPWEQRERRWMEPRTHYP